MCGSNPSAGVKMIEKLKNHLKDIPLLLRSNNWDSVLIENYPPVIYRLSTKIDNENSIYLHKIHHTNENPYIHSHSWPFACYVLEGGYEMGIGFSTERNKIPEIISKIIIKPKQFYEITSSNLFHYTKAFESKPSYSIMLVGKRWRERESKNNKKLNEEQLKEMFSYFNLLKCEENL